MGVTIKSGNDSLRCSFCGKTQRQVRKLIAGPNVYICNECVELCLEIVEEEEAPPVPQPNRLGRLRRALRGSRPR